MNKKDYERELNELNTMIEELRVKRITLIENFKENCKHLKRHIKVERVYLEDEYGRYNPEWSEYIYECTHCGKKMISQISLDYEQIKVKMGKTKK